MAVHLRKSDDNIFGSSRFYCPGCSKLSGYLVVKDGHNLCPDCGTELTGNESTPLTWSSLIPLVFWGSIIFFFIKDMVGF